MKFRSSLRVHVARPPAPTRDLYNKPCDNRTMIRLQHLVARTVRGTHNSASTRLLVQDTVRPRWRSSLLRRVVRDGAAVVLVRGSECKLTLGKALEDVPTLHFTTKLVSQTKRLVVPGSDERFDFITRRVDAIVEVA
jgi:hypothetical protein